MLPLPFSNVLDSKNPSILRSLRLLLPKPSTSAFYCFQICKKLHSLKSWPSYISIVSSLYLALHYNKRFLLFNWMKLEIFVNKCPISLFHLHLKKCITKIHFHERTFAFDHLHLLLAYDIFLGEFLQIKALRYFEGIWR